MAPDAEPPPAALLALTVACPTGTRGCLQANLNRRSTSTPTDFYCRFWLTLAGAPGKMLAELPSPTIVVRWRAGCWSKTGTTRAKAIVSSTRKFQPRFQSAAVAIGERERAAKRAGKLLGDGKAKSGATGFATARSLDPIKRQEY